MRDLSDHNFTGSTGDSEKDMDGREALVEGCLDRLFVAFDSGCEEGFLDPVVLLVDCEDAIGAPVARSWEGNDAVDAAIMENADAAEDPEKFPTTILIRVVSFTDGQQELPKWFPYLQDAFSHGPPRDGFYVVAITFGGAGTFTVPLNARPL